MSEKIVVGEVEVKAEAVAVEVMDLGDAGAETRVYHPTQVITDSAWQLGRSFFE